jgi:uncharacterized protein (UPF0333 family)
MRGDYKMYKKAQAAMEFLMTYGWAILVVLVAIGALAYFGVLTPDKFLPNKCTLPAGIGCVDHKATPNGVTVVLRNGLGYDMSNVTVGIENCGIDNNPSTIPNGEKAEYSVSCSGYMSGKSKFSGELNVTYYLSDTELTHTAKGSIITKVE